MTDRRSLDHGKPTPDRLGRPYAYATRRAGGLFTMCPWCWRLHRHGTAAVVGDPFIDSRAAHCAARPRPGMYVLTTDPALFGRHCADYPPELIPAPVLRPRDRAALDALRVPIGAPDPRPALAAERAEASPSPAEVVP